MQGLYVLLIAASVATAYVTYPSPATVDGIDCPIHAGCPAVDSPEFTVHLADKNDCHKYYKCVSGRGCLQVCPLYNEGRNRLVFNPKLEVCDWPENVPEAHCNDAPATEPKPTPTKPIPDPSEASASTKPQPSDPATQPTPAPSSSTTTEAAPSKPSSSPAPTGTPAPTETAAPTGTPAPTETAAPTGTPAPPATSTTTAAPTASDAPTTTGAPTATAGPTEPSSVPGKCAAQGNLPVAHESDCRAYYNCHNGLRSDVQYCLEGNMFNPIQHTCDLLTNETAKYCPKPPSSN